MESRKHRSVRSHRDYANATVELGQSHKPSSGMAGRQVARPAASFSSLRAISDGRWSPAGASSTSGRTTAWTHSSRSISAQGQTESTRPQQQNLVGTSAKPLPDVIPRARSVWSSLSELRHQLHWRLMLSRASRSPLIIGPDPEPQAVRSCASRGTRSLRRACPRNRRTPRAGH